jgi:hypothetical protein
MSECHVISAPTCPWLGGSICRRRLGAAYMSMSRMGMLLPRNSPFPAACANHFSQENRKPHSRKAQTAARAHALKEGITAGTLQVGDAHSA